MPDIPNRLPVYFTDEQQMLFHLEARGLKQGVDYVVHDRSKGTAPEGKRVTPRSFLSVPADHDAGQITSQSLPVGMASTSIDAVPAAMKNGCDDSNGFANLKRYRVEVLETKRVIFDIDAHNEETARSYARASIGHRTILTDKREVVQIKDITNGDID